MEAKLVFNDQSVTTAASNKVARAWFTNMMEAVADLINEEINGKRICRKVIRSNKYFYDIDLTEDYGYQEWLEDSLVETMLKRLALQMDYRHPVYQQVKTNTKAYDDFLGSEFFLKETPEIQVTALGVALLEDGIAISLPSEQHWCQSKIEIVQKLYDEELELPHQIHHCVNHVSRPDDVDSAIRGWQHTLSQKIKNAKQLVEQWRIVFSHLDWCEEYEKKMLPYLQYKKTLESVLHRLWQLDEACHQWDIEPQPTYPMFARPESRKTMTNKKLAQMRQATCPYQGKQYFEWHCDIQPDGYRLYWLVNKDLCRITVCYIGPHLETNKFKGQ